MAARTQRMLAQKVQQFFSSPRFPPAVWPQEVFVLQKRMGKYNFNLDLGNLAKWTNPWLPAGRAVRFRAPRGPSLAGRPAPSWRAVAPGPHTFPAAVGTAAARRNTCGPWCATRRSPRPAVSAWRRCVRWRALRPLERGRSNLLKFGS